MLINVDGEGRPEAGIIVVSEQNVRAVLFSLSSSRWPDFTPGGGFRISI